MPIAMKCLGTLKRFALVLPLGLIAAHTVGSAQAQQDVKRTDLQRHDLSIPGRETLQVRVDFPPGVLAPRHTHFGEEIVYVLEGTLLYEIEGRPSVTLKAGEVLFIPYGVIHSAKNIGNTNAAELATYVVEKGKPLVVLAK
jgi:quercetin dioxygenase-like cupin family protein